MQPIGIYIHWPFCLSKCPYCDFNSHVRNNIDEDLWLRCLRQELSYWHELSNDRYVKTIFFGGGTPSLMAPHTVDRLIDDIKKKWICDPEIEVTLEANPNSIETQKFNDFKAAGINRVSIGIQSLNDSELKFLGRKHSKKEAIEALKIAAKIFDNYSFDLIYARPNQTWTTWRQELDEAMPYIRYHLSLYQLTIEPNTAFYGAFKRGQYNLPENDIQAELYTNTADYLSNYGFVNYEISNYAHPAFECQHNLVYWRYQDYLAIGPGAHGRLTLEGKKVALTNLRAPETWLKAVTTNNHGLQSKVDLSIENQFHEALIMGLRLQEGVSLKRLQEIDFLTTEKMLINNNFRKFVNEAYLIIESDTIRTSTEGKLYLNYILAKIV